MQYRILLVDDDPEVFDLLGGLLAAEGYEVRWAPSAEDFRREALENTPHLIVLDIMLGEVNGPETYTHILGLGLDRNIPVIFLSGLVDRRQKTESSPGRHYAMHPKPFDFDDLLRDVRSLTRTAA